MNEEEKTYSNNKHFFSINLLKQLTVLSYIENLLIQNNTALKRCNGP